MGWEDGLRGVESLGTDLKLIWSVASNILINQHANVNRSAGILRDERLVEFHVVQDNFLTPTARFADLILPACTQFETWGLQDGWKYGDDILLAPQILDPPGEAKSDYWIGSELARRLGLYEAYTEGRTEKDWVAWGLARYREKRYPDLPSVEALENAGMYAVPDREPAVAFAKFREDPQRNPLPTPSGRIEIFSKQLHNLGRPDEIPAVPKYIREWESPFGPEAEAYPLQAVGHHALSRVHSTHDNNPALAEGFPQRVFMNPIDAGPRRIRDGDPVKLWNERGTIVIRCRITERIMPGVVAVPQGAWWKPDEDGLDRGGNINVLTSERWTPLAFGNAQHTIMVQAAKAKKAGRR